MMRVVTTEATSRGWRPDDSSFGARLALVRQRMGWGNVKEAALACGLPVESWRNWERDGREPRSYIAVCQKISERTGADMAWLAGMPLGAAGYDELGPAGAVTRGNRAAESRCTPAWAEDTSAPSPLEQARQRWGAAEIVPGDGVAA